MDNAEGKPAALDGTGKPARRAGRLGNLGLVLASIVLSIVMIEIAFRVVSDLPVFEVKDWRTGRVVFNRLGDRAELDPELGWRLIPNRRSDWHNTLDYGIRRNYEETTIRTGEILAVGDSFTEGWELEDDDSWPAYLELHSKIPVVNGGVGGYGTDQIVLRAEQLLPIVKPKILIVGFLQFDIFRTAHSHFGAPKPWYSIANGSLVYHPPAPVEKAAEPTVAARAALAARDILSYSAVADFLFARLAANFWYGSGRQEYIKADTDPVQVTCLLLERLKKRVDADKIRMILFMQYYAPVIMFNPQPPEDARQVNACAEKLGIEVVDQFASLKALTASDPHALRNYYMVYGDTFTHMNADGNDHAAKLLLQALKRE